MLKRREPKYVQREAGPSEFRVLPPHQDHFQTHSSTTTGTPTVNPAMHAYYCINYHPDGWCYHNADIDPITAPFDDATKAYLIAFYRDRCAHARAVELGVMDKDYCRYSEDNLNLIALCPPHPVLKYIRDALLDPNNSLSVYEICTKLNKLTLHRPPPQLLPPSLRSIYPYLGLYTLALLNTEATKECMIMTTCMPPVSYIQYDQFVSSGEYPLSLAGDGDGDEGEVDLIGSESEPGPGAYVLDYTKHNYEDVT
ncbi:hypothetical protein BD410DRAFT_833373, partial [Rickenella mellea]